MANVQPVLLRKWNRMMAVLWYTLIFGTLMLAIMHLLFEWQFGHSIIRPHVLLTCFAIGWIFCMMFAIILARRRSHLLRHAKENGYRLCLHCGHSLRGLEGDEGACPECGTHFRINEVERTWQQVSETSH